MTTKENTGENFKKTFGLFAAVVVVIVCAVIGLGIYKEYKDRSGFYEDQLANFKRPEFQLKGFADSKVSATLAWQGKVLPMTYDDGKIKFSDDFQDQILPPYELSVSVQDPAQNFYDFTLSIYEAGHGVTLYAAGFKAAQKLSLLLGDHVVFENMPFDWSGRLTLETGIDSPVPMPMCGKVSGSANISLCHTFPIGWLK
jgi:hypothetical protein